jgi:RNA polymerase-binding transcription factor DksA
MEAMTPTREDLRAYQRHLQALADRLSGGIDQLTAEATRPTGGEGRASEPTDACGEGDGEVARGVLLSEEHLLAEVRAALDRFDAGTFGRCEGCGRAVARARLRAIPYARHCIRCASAAHGEPAGHHCPTTGEASRCRGAKGCGGTCRR